MIHKPVLLEEVIDNLNLKPGMTVVDGTLGAGGHSAAILEKIIPGGKLISIDWDAKSVESFEKKLQKGFIVAKRELIFTHAHDCAIGRSAISAPVNIKNNNDDQAISHFEKLGNREGKIVGYWRGAADNYANIKKIIRGLGVKTVDAVFVDLGFSSDQIEDSERGFSFLSNGPLDMRYSSDEQARTAGEIVNEYGENELIRIFKNLGEEKFAKKIAREIVRAKKFERIGETKDLVKIISRAVPEKYKRGRVHFATKIFQALRIETNHELENLKKFLDQAIQVLASEGILAIISFHSLEDRIVKNFFREESKNCICPPDFPKCVCEHRARLKTITKKPISASDSEIKDNPRSRSAKLRVAQKL